MYPQRSLNNMQEPEQTEVQPPIVEVEVLPEAEEEAVVPSMEEPPALVRDVATPPDSPAPVSSS